MPASHRTRRPRRPRRGDTIVEALVAAFLLTVGGLALLGLTATLARDERRATGRRRAADVLDARLMRWAAGPCATADGAARTDALDEWWRTRVDVDSLEQLVDSVRAATDPQGAREGVVAWRACPP